MTNISKYLYLYRKKIPDKSPPPLSSIHLKSYHSIFKTNKTMKLYSFIRLFCLLAYSLLLLACNNNDDDDATPDSGLAPEGQMIATIDGEAWNSNVVSARVVTFTNTQSLRLLGYVSISTSNLITIDFRNFDQQIEERTYTSSGPTDGMFAFRYDRDGNTFSISSGNSMTLTVTEFDAANKTISGTFSGNVSDWQGQEQTVNITNGSFTKISYTE